MLKSTILAGLLGLATLSVAYADTDTTQCTDAGMKMLQDSIDKTTDQTMKDQAMKEMMMAQDAMKANKLDECAQHMGMSMQAAGAMK